MWSAQRSQRYSSLNAAQRFVDYTTKHYAPSIARTQGFAPRLIQAGIYDPQAVPTSSWPAQVLAVVLALPFFFVSAVARVRPQSPFWLYRDVGGVAGYLAPSFTSMRIATPRGVSAGFPDFMDLLVVCADAGLSHGSGVGPGPARTRRRLSFAGGQHPHDEPRNPRRPDADRSPRHFGDRLGLDEARSFATLIQQSDELGSSISEALRSTHDDMRHKRMSRAEEKAYSLPAKLPCR